jgi:hypothetical protein
MAGGQWNKCLLAIEIQLGWLVLVLGLAMLVLMDVTQMLATLILVVMCKPVRHCCLNCQSRRRPPVREAKL